MTQASFRVAHLMEAQLADAFSTPGQKSRRSDELTSGGCGLTPLPIIESEFKKNVTRRTETG